MVTLSLLFVFLFNIAVSAAGNDRELIMSELPEQMKQVIIQHENEGRNIIFDSEKNRSMISPLASTKVNLPANGYTTDKTFSSAGQSFTVGADFIATADCNMKLFLSTTIWNDPAYFTVVVKNVTTGRNVFNNTLLIESEPDAPLYVPISEGNTYTVTITSKAANTHIAAYICGG